MPVPVSETSSRTWRPGCTRGNRPWARSSRSTSLVRIAIAPLPSIASRALTTRFITTCSSWRRPPRPPRSAGGRRRARCGGRACAGSAPPSRGARVGRDARREVLAAPREPEQRARELGRVLGDLVDATRGRSCGAVGSLGGASRRRAAGSWRAGC